MMVKKQAMMLSSGWATKARVVSGFHALLFRFPVQQQGRYIDDETIVTGRWG